MKGVPSIHRDRWPASLVGVVGRWDILRTALPWAVLVAIVGAAAGFYFDVFVRDGPPTGLDGGNWLSLTYEFFGRSVKAAHLLYPPVSMVVMRVLLLFFDPLTTVEATAVLAGTAAVVPLFFLLRSGAPLFIAGTLSLAFALGGLHGEIAAFGGYPELLGTAFLLAALYWLGRGLREGQNLALVLSAAAAALAIGSHHLIALELLISIPIFGAFTALQERANLRPMIPRAGAWVSLSVLFTLPFAPMYVWMATNVSGDYVNQQEFTLQDFPDVWAGLFRDRQQLWLGATAAAYLTLLLPLGKTRASQLKPAAAALLLAPLVTFGLLQEMRSLDLMQPGIVVGIAALGSAMCDVVSRTLGRRRDVSLLLVGAVAALAALFALGVATSGHDRTLERARFYRVLSPTTYEAINWLATETPPGSVIVASQAPRGRVYGGWIEALAKRPTYAAAQPRQMAFEEERANKLVARELILGALSREAAIALIEEHGIDYFFIDKTAPGFFPELASRVGLRKEFENAQIIIWSYPGSEGGGSVRPLEERRLRTKGLR